MKMGKMTSRKDAKPQRFFEGIKRLPVSGLRPPVTAPAPQATYY